jgi:hypothetical protein
MTDCLSFPQLAGGQRTAKLRGHFSNSRLANFALNSQKLRKATDSYPMLSCPQLMRSLRHLGLNEAIATQQRLTAFLEQYSTFYLC